MPTNTTELPPYIICRLEAALASGVLPVDPTDMAILSVIDRADYVLLAWRWLADRRHAADEPLPQG